MNIDDIEVCQPVVKLVDSLSNNGFKIVEKKVQDYHFREVYIKMIGSDSSEVVVDGVKKINPTRYVCDCHWSTLEIANG